MAFDFQTLDQGSCLPLPEGVEHGFEGFVAIFLFFFFRAKEDR